MGDQTGIENSRPCAAVMEGEMEKGSENDHLNLNRLKSIFIMNYKLEHPTKLHAPMSLLQPMPKTRPFLSAQASFQIPLDTSPPSQCELPARAGSQSEALFTRTF
jgi:hypothetical protein